MINYIFDGTFNGLLTAIFESYQLKNNQVKIISESNYMPDLFVDEITITTDLAKAKRVWDGLKQKISKSHLNEFYNSFLSENPAMFQILFEYAKYIFDHKKGVDQNFGNQYVLSIAQMSRKVYREKHRMEAFIRFQKSGNEMYYAIIAPDFNVIPLIVKHFKNRYADQPWIIYDEKRKYGVYYDLETVVEVTFDLQTQNDTLVKSEEITLDEKEELYEKLWKGYFTSTNIVERKNMKLHLQHVPKRYWKYLTEKK